MSDVEKEVNDAFREHLKEQAEEARNLEANQKRKILDGLRQKI